MVAADRRDVADLIVVGASIGGLAAAVLAADRGRRVIVVERGRDLGGTAASTSETILAAGTRFQRDAGVVDAAERLADDLGAAAPPQWHDATRAVAAQSAATVEWLADRCGIPVVLLPPPPEAATPIRRLHACGTHGGADLVGALARAATRHHRVKIRLGLDVVDLLRDGAGAVAGVSLRPERRGSVAIEGPVLLATGGFAGNDELIALHAPAAAAVPWLGAGTATGDGLRLGLAVGAAGTHLDACDVTPLLAQPGHLEVPHRLVSLGAILVNQAGRRFIDESAQPPVVAAAVRAQPGRVAYLVFDDRIATQASAVDPWLEHVVLPRTQRRGATPADLGKQFELDAEALADAVAQCGRGSDATGRSYAGPPLTPPLHAIRVTAARRRTRGGLRVDASARVLDADGAPIAGLFAAGGVAASLDAAAGHPWEGIEALGALARGRLAALAAIAADTAPEPAATP